VAVCLRYGVHAAWLSLAKTVYNQSQMLAKTTITVTVKMDLMRQLHQPVQGRLAPGTCISNTLLHKFCNSVECRQFRIDV
jgi:hypothetical protein